MTCKLGLDTGGTFTDAVLLSDAGEIIAHAKSPTTHHNLSIGLRGAVSAVMHKIDQTESPVSLVSLSTTLATNALVEGYGRKVCLVLAGYSEQQLKRARLSEVMGSDPVLFIAGGHNASGEALQEPDFAELEKQLAAIDESVDAYAVSAMFSVRNPAHEIVIRDWLLAKTSKPVSCGYELSSALDAPRRALTAVLNARLIPLIHNLLNATTDMLAGFRVEAPLMVVKGDGSLVTAQVATVSPVETILSGPAASVVGASYLNDKRDLVVADMGGTTTDIAVVENGRPLLDPQGATVGGWTTMVRAIRINTYGLGGDSEISFDRENRQFKIGPQRVTPVSTFLRNHPEFVATLEKQLELPFSTTHSAQFVFIPALGSVTANDEKAPAVEMPPGLSGQQRELWQRLIEKPMAVQTLFEDQTLDLAFRRLVAAGHIAHAAFTPTDALLVIGSEQLQAQGQNRQAAVLAAKLLQRYSRQNLGPVWSAEVEFANTMREQVARDAAMAIVETVLAREASDDAKANTGADDTGQQKTAGSAVSNRSSHPNRRFARRQLARNGLHSEQRALIENIFEGGESSLSLRAALAHPLVGLGAPATGYYERVAELLGTTADVPELAGVANAIGAVVGTVNISRSLTITPLGGKRVQVHREDGPAEFAGLEEAAEAARVELEERVVALATDAGAIDIQTGYERNDIVAENQGEKVFFESTITVSAHGRPASAAD